MLRLIKHAILKSLFISYPFPPPPSFKKIVSMENTRSYAEEAGYLLQRYGALYRDKVKL